MWINKQIILILWWVLATYTVSAKIDSISHVPKLVQSGHFKEARIIMDQAITNKKFAKQAPTWYYYAFIYKALYKSPEGTKEDKISFRQKAIQGFSKSLVIDSKGDYAEGCKLSLKFLVNTHHNDAVQYLNNQKFRPAFKNYKTYLKGMNVLDSTSIEDKVIFYAGYSAYMCDEYEAAIKYLEVVRAHKYKEPLIYFFLGKMYHDTNQWNIADKVLKEGIHNFPTNMDLKDLYQTLLQPCGFGGLEKELNQAIEYSPTNMELRITLALLFEKKAEIAYADSTELINKAEAVYKTIILMDSTHVRAHYNLGLLYYNQNLALIKSKKKHPLSEKEEIKQRYTSALSLLTKAKRLSPESTEVQQKLEEVYLQMTKEEH